MEKGTFVLSQKGHNKFEYQGFLFYKNSEQTNSDLHTIQWVCERRDMHCGVTIRTDSDGNIIRGPTKQHTHLPDPQKIVATKRKADMLERSRLNPDEPPSKIYTELVSKDIVSTLPSEDNIKQSIRYQRRKDRPIESSSADDLEVSNEWALTLEGKQFLFGKVKVETDSHQEIGFIFTTTENLGHLNMSPLVFADGTFSISPVQFYQLYTLHGLVFGKVFPLVYIFLNRKTQSLYIKVLQYICDRCIEFDIEFDIKKLSIDFEQSAINAFQDVFPRIEITCCQFHFSQSIIRKMNELGLKHLYQSSEDINFQVRQIIALSFVSETDLFETYEQLKEHLDNKLRKLIDYFESTYLYGRKIRKARNGTFVRAKPLYPPTIWSVYENAELRLPTTNNSVESWHRRMKSIVPRNHPSFYSALSYIKKEQKHTEVEIHRLSIGGRLRRINRLVSIRQSRLQRLIEMFKNGESSGFIYLQGIANNFEPISDSNDEVDSDSDSKENENLDYPESFSIINTTDLLLPVFTTSEENDWPSPPRDLMTINHMPFDDNNEVSPPPPPPPIIEEPNSLLSTSDNEEFPLPPPELYTFYTAENSELPDADSLTAPIDSMNIHSLKVLQTPSRRIIDKSPSSQRFSPYTNLVQSSNLSNFPSLIPQLSPIHESEDVDSDSIVLPLTTWSQLF